jgi:hypothetical protein
MLSKNLALKFLRSSAANQTGRKMMQRGMSSIGGNNSQLREATNFDAGI